ncbi:MAG: pre-peptidase C-terminal domain-containing protein [Planctomycetota bacterium]|nr:pre-peptidase C-terminal domain-containing protein [Planctomycetota bacterium]
MARTKDSLWRGLHALATLALIVECRSYVGAQLPSARLLTVYPPGGKAGTTVDVTLVGGDLDDAKALRFSHPGIQSVQKTTPPGPYDDGPLPLSGQYSVTIAGDVPSGLYEVRAVGRYGISNPRAFVVGSLTEAAEKEPNETAEQATEVSLGSTVNGRSDRGTDLDHFRFAARKGQRVIVECRARSIDSRLDAALFLYDAAGQELTCSRRGLRGDPLIDFTAPADGNYVVKLHDALYRGSGEYFYRLSFSTGPHVDFIFPPAGVPGNEGEFRVFGRALPGGEPVPGMEIDGCPLEAIVVKMKVPDEAALPDLRFHVPSSASFVEGFEYRLKTESGESDPFLVGYAAATVTLEKEPNDDPAQATPVKTPCEFVGQFYPRGDHDWLTFEAEKGQSLWVEVFSHRLGLPTDPYILLQLVKKDGDKESVRDLKRSDDIGRTAGDGHFDTTTDDPGFRFVAPETGTYRILLRDLADRVGGDPRLVYRLALVPDRPGFRLLAVTRAPALDPDPRKNKPGFSNLSLRQGGTAMVEVMALRRHGFGGEIRVAVEGLPDGVSCPEAVIPPGASSTGLIFSAKEDAAAWQGTIRIAGRARVGEAEVSQPARYGALVWPEGNNQGPRSRLTDSLALAVSAVEKAPLLVVAGEQKSWEMCRGGKLKIPVKLTRRSAVKGAVNLQPVGLPKGVQGKKFSLDEKTNAGALELEIKKDAVPGTYTFYVQATAQVSYSRGADVAKAAEEKQKKLEKIVAGLKEEVKESAEARKKAEQLAGELAPALRKAEEAVAVAETALIALKTASDGGSEQKIEEAISRLVTSVEIRTQVAPGTKSAEEARASAVARGEKAQKDEAAASKAFEAAKKRAGETAKAAKPKNVKIAPPSTPVQLNVRPAPIAFKEPAEDAPALEVVSGGKLQVSVTFDRLFGFDGPIDLSLSLPGNAKGLQVKKVSVAKGQAKGVLEVVAAPEAAPGVHEGTLTARVKFNGQDLQIQRNLRLGVKAAEKKEVASENKKNDGKAK